MTGVRGPYNLDGSATAGWVEPSFFVGRVKKDGMDVTFTPLAIREAPLSASILFFPHIIFFLRPSQSKLSMCHYSPSSSQACVVICPRAAMVRVRISSHATMAGAGAHQAPWLGLELARTTMAGGLSLLSAFGRHGSTGAVVLWRKAPSPCMRPPCPT